MPKGYVIIVRDYIAEICEFKTIEIVHAPDGTIIYHVQTKFGEDYFRESEVKPVRKMLETECEELNKALSGAKNAKSNHKNHRW